MIISRKTLIGGVLTDMTSVVLSDPTGTFGVRRTDTNAIIVADGTAMTHDGTGLYSYEFTEPAVGLTYEYWMEIVYSGATYHVQKFAYGVSSSPAGTMYLSTARGLVRFWARHAGDSKYYATSVLDFAIQDAADDLIRRAGLLFRVDTFDTVAGVENYAVTPETFRPDRLKTMWLSGANVAINAAVPNATYPDAPSEFTVGGPEYYNGPMNRTSQLDIRSNVEINDYTIATGMSGQPYMAGFESNLSVDLYPNPDQVYTVNLRWSDFFTTWTCGTALTLAALGSAPFVASVSVIDGSDHYTSAPTVTFSGGTTGSAATATATIDGSGTVTAINVTQSGSGYTSIPTVLLNGHSSTDVLFNLPDDQIKKVIRLGAAVYLLDNEPEGNYGKDKRDAWEAYIRDVIGTIGGLGAQSVRVVRRR